MGFGISKVRTYKTTIADPLPVEATHDLRSFSRPYSIHNSIIDSVLDLVLMVTRFDTCASHDIRHITT